MSRPMLRPIVRWTAALSAGCLLAALAPSASAQDTVSETEIRIFDKYGTEVKPTSFLFFVDGEGPFAETYTGAGSCVLEDLEVGQRLRFDVSVPPLGPSSATLEVTPGMNGIRIVVGNHVSTATPHDFGTNKRSKRSEPGTADAPVEVDVVEGGVLLGAPPAFDECIGAVKIGVGAQAPFDNSQATTNPADPLVSCYPGGPAQGARSFWFRFVAPTNHLVVRTTSNAVAVPTVPVLVAVYEGDCGQLIETSCGFANTGEVIDVPVNTTLGTNITVQLSTLTDLDIGIMPATLLAVAPPNDECVGATPLPCDGFVVADNREASTALDDPAFACPLVPTSGDGSIWYSFVPTSQRAVFATSAFPGSLVNDTLLSVYVGACGGLVQLGCSDDDGDGLFSEVVLTGLTPGVPLLVEAASFPGSPQGGFFLTANCCPGGFMSYSQGCGGVNGTPELSSADCPVLGADVDIDITGGFPSAHGCLVVSEGLGSTPLYGCDLLIDPSQQFIFPNTLDPLGNQTITLPIAPDFAGGIYFLQAFYVDPTAPQGFSFSNGLMMSTSL